MKTVTVPANVAKALKIKVKSEIDADIIRAKLYKISNIGNALDTMFQEYTSRFRSGDYTRNKFDDNDVKLLDETSDTLNAIYKNLKKFKKKARLK